VHPLSKEVLESWKVRKSAALQAAFNPSAVPGKAVHFFKASTTLYPSDQMGFSKAVAVAVLKKAPVLGLYMDRIHTWRDTRWDPRNIDFLAGALVRLAAPELFLRNEATPSMDNLILCGFMGCGKSTVGRLLAQATGREFVDMDTYIEGQSGMTVPEIFSQYGETDFRRREREACAALAGRRGLVIAAGGGALVSEENARVLGASGTIVLLEVSPETVLSRLEGDTSRPLLLRPDRDKAVRELMEQRLPLYRKAAAMAVSGEAEPAVVVQSVLNRL
jgi:shikimate kinase